MRDSDIDALSADGAQETKPDLRRLAEQAKTSQVARLRLAAAATPDVVLKLLDDLQREGDDKAQAQSDWEYVKADRDALAAAAKAVVLAAKEHTPEIAALNATLTQHVEPAAVRYAAGPYYRNRPAAATDPNITINHPAQAAEPLDALLERIAVEEGQHGPSMVKRLRDSGYVIRAAAATGIDVDLLAVARHYARLLADKP